jgi:tRNA(fMet)-specific endonuclease VapC
MNFLLDTNVCITYLNGRHPGLVKKLHSIPPTELAVCSIVKAELFYGAAKSKRQAHNLAIQQAFLKPYVSLPFDDQAADIFGRERTRLESIGAIIGPYDLMIASIALANNLILVTNNTREFSRVNGLRYEDWQALP